MRTESEIIADVKSIVSAHISNFSTEVLSRKVETVSSLHTSIAFFFQDGKISTALLKDLLNYVAQNDRNNIVFETKKELGNLDFEVIIVYAEIFYI